MMGQILTPETVQRFAGSLLHFLWQGAAIAVAASIGLRMLQRRSAELRYAVSVGAMILMLAAPVATFIFYKETGALALQLLQLTGKTLADATPSATFSQAAASSQAAATAAWTRWILLTWSIGVFVFTARLVAGWRLSHRLVNESNTLIPDSVLRLFEDLKRRLQLSRPIQLLIHTQIDTPMVVGCLKPAVLVPLSALTGLTEEQLTAILAHELAHIRRHDFLINILQRCVESLLFYHPGVWWLSARVRTEREHCCDDVAVRLCGDRRSYVQALVELERNRQSVPVLSVAATGGSLVQRVHRILGVKTSNTDWQSAAATLVFVLVWFVAGALQSSTTLQAKPSLPTTAAPAAVVLLPVAASPAPVAQTVNAITAIITAQPQPPTELTLEPQAAATLSGKGSIQGVVTRAGSAQPIPGARVSIVDAPADPEALKTLLAFFAARGVTMDPPAPGNEDKFFQTLLDTLAAKGVSTSLPANQLAIEQFRAANTEKYTVVADAGGRFTFREIPSGKYSLSAEREGYFGSKGNEPIAVVEAGKPADIAVPLMPGATISGRVKNAEGRTVSNINVTAHLITYANGKILPVAQSSQTSDDRGEYRLFWLPPGEYIVVADPVSTAPAPPPPPPPPPPGGDGGPVIQGGVPAGVAGGRGNVIAPVSPKYMKTFYPQSLTTVEARTVNVKEGEQVSGTDITLQKGATYKISGTVHAMTGSAFIPQGRGRGAANPNAPQGVTGYLGLEFRDSSVIDMRSTNLGGTVPSIGTFFLTPADDGFNATFEVQNILPGEYYLVPRLQQAVPQGSGNFTINRVPIDIRDRDITNLALELFVGVNLNGTVTVDGHAPGTATVRVALRADGNPSPTYQGITARAVIAKADDGTFVIPTLPPARYRVELGAGLPPDLYLAEVRQGAISVYDTGIEIGKEAPAPLQLTLRSGAATVEGLVRDSLGKPVANATVVVIPPDPRRDNRALYKTATSDAAGRFTVQGIAPGGYKVFAWQGVSGGDFYNSRFLSKYEFRGKSINVAQGTTLTENLTVIDKF